MTLWLVVHVLFCYFLPELKAHLSGEFEKEICTDVNDVTKSDNVGVMFQGESRTIEKEILLPLDTKLKEIFGIRLPPKDVGNALQLLKFSKVFMLTIWYDVLFD